MDRATAVPPIAADDRVFAVSIDGRLGSEDSFEILHSAARETLATAAFFAKPIGSLSGGAGFAIASAKLDE